MNPPTGHGEKTPLEIVTEAYAKAVVELVVTRAEVEQLQAENERLNDLLSLSTEDAES